MELFKLVGSIFIDNTEANNSIQKTDEKVETLGTKFKNGVTTVAKWGAALGAAALAAGGAMVKAAKDQAANLDVIDKASIRMGISAESYQELAYAAGLCGVEMSTMEKAAKKLEGTDLNMEQALDQLMAITDETERTQAAIDMFGESIAYQMTPLLQTGADGLAEMKDEANSLGLVMSQDTVTAGAAMSDSFSKVEQSLASLKNGLVAEFMPYVQKALDWVIEHMPEIKQTVTNIMTAVGKAINTVKPVIEAVAAKAVEIWNTIIKPVLQTAIAWIKEHMPEIKATISNIISAIKTVIETVKPVVERVFNGIINLWNGTLKPILESIISFLRDVFKGNWSNIWNDIKNIFGSVFEGLKNLFKTPINWIIDKLNSFIRGVNKIKIPDWVPGVGGKGINISTIPKLASGGVLEAGQVGLLEGSGAEAVVPLEKNKAWISAVAEDMQGYGLGGKETVSLLKEMLSKLDAVAKMGIYLDGKTLVGEIAPNMDTALGKMATRQGRFV